MKARRFGAAALAAVTALSLNTGVANAADKQYTIGEGIAALEFIGLLAKNGWGAAPDTEFAGKMAAGSIEAGSSGSQAYWASQVGWGALWAGIAGTILTVGYNEAVKAGLVKPIM